MKRLLASMLAIRHFFLLLFLVFSATLLAHKPDQSYVYLSIYEDKIEGNFQITAQDLNLALGTDIQRGATAEELTNILPQIKAYLKSRSSFDSEQGPLEVVFTDGVEFIDLDMGYYLILNFAMPAASPVPDQITSDFTALFDKKPTHRNFLIQRYNWKAGIHDNESMISLSYGPGKGPQTLDLASFSVFRGFWAMVESGMFHIYIGLDHILFILALLLPAVVRRRKDSQGILGQWEPVEKFKPAFIYILKIVTFFTIAHSLTLSAAALGWINLPSNIVESLIALSIALAAFHNIKPFYKNESIAIAFVFGLFHGFGFASVMGEIGLQGEYMAFTLLGFNVGVELAQILIICLAFPILYFLRKNKYYIPGILVGGSIILIIISLYWFIERFFGVDLPAGAIVYSVIDGIKGIFG